VVGHGGQRALPSLDSSHTLRYVNAAAPPLPRAASAQLTRGRLLDAAIARFAADGLEASFATVAADAGVTKGALYHHFASKQGLVDAVYREAIQRHAARVVAASSDGTGRERLLGLVASSLELYTSRTPFYGLLWQLHAAAARSDVLARIAGRSQRNQREYLADLIVRGQRDGSIRAGLDPEALALTVNATLVGLLAQDHVDPQLLSRFTSLLEDLLQ
jgi:AcrR family transcriptional regulator